MLAVGDDEGKREAAGRIMSYWGSLDDAKLPDIVAALEKHPGGWPAGALERIHSEGATRALIDDVSRIGGGNQSSHALGQRLPEAFDAVIRSGIEADTLALRSGVGGELAFLMRTAVDDPRQARRQQRIGEWLMEAAIEPGKDTRYRREATGYLMDLGKLQGIDLAPLQTNLSSDDKLLAGWTRVFLKRQGHPAMLPEIIRDCDALLAAKGANREYAMFPVNVFENCLDPLARIGGDAATAVPRLREWAGSAEPGSRNMVIATFGYVADASAIPFLEDRLASADERDVAAGLESLWRLRAISSIPAIREVGRSHWYGPVREFARRVADALEKGDSRAVQGALVRDSREESLTSKHVWGVRLHDAAQRRWCVAWRVDGKVVDERHRLGVAPGMLSAQGLRADEVRTAMALGDGLLYGIDKGEFGGGLVYRDGTGSEQRLTDENTVALVPRNGDALAFVGLAHLMDRGGAILRIGRNGGNIGIVEGRRLPSAPVSVYAIDNGWLVETASHLGVVVRPDLTLAEAECVRVAEGS